MKTVKDIAWLAGLLEGEGYFAVAHPLQGPKHKRKRYTVVRIVLSMTDRDVVERAAAMFGTVVLGPYKYERADRPNTKPLYQCSVGGTRAASWMMTLYSLMGERRRTRIGECLAAWKSQQVLRRIPRGVTLCAS